MHNFISSWAVGHIAYFFHGFLNVLQGLQYKTFLRITEWKTQTFRFFFQKENIDEHQARARRGTRQHTEVHSTAKDTSMHTCHFHPSQLSSVFLTFIQALIHTLAHRLKKGALCNVAHNKSSLILYLYSNINNQTTILYPRAYNAEIFFYFGLSMFYWVWEQVLKT